MKFLERIIIVLMAITTIGPFFPVISGHEYFIYLSFAALVCVLACLVTGKFQWQMIPVSVASAIMSALGVYQILNLSVELSFFLFILFNGTGLVLLCLTIALRYLFPLFDSPKPSGRYGVGICDFYLKDESRKETFSKNPKDVREMMVTAWYPANVTGDLKPEPFLRNAKVIGSDILGIMHMPRFLFNHLDLIKSHSYLDAPISTEKNCYPVLVFSHGFTSYAAQNSLLMEHLASHGYIVFSLTHPYESAGVCFSDTRTVKVLRSNADKLLGANKKEMMENMEALLSSLMAENRQDFESQIQQYMNAVPNAFTSVERWVKDTCFFVDELEKINATHPAKKFSSRLNLDQLGIFGMSLGGATAGKFATSDSRCKAGINLDGLFFNDTVDLKTQQPFMILNSDVLTVEKAVKGFCFDKPIQYHWNDFVYNRARDMIYSVTINQSTHVNFSDLAMISPAFKWLGMTGKIKGDLMNEIMNSYVLAFFNKHLLGQKEPLLDGPAKRYSQVEFKKRDGGISE